MPAGHHGREKGQIPVDPALFLVPTIKRTSQLQKALTQQISLTSIVHCSSERSLNDMNRERNSLIVVRDHVERLLNMLLEIRRLGAGDLVTKDSCLKQLDDFRHSLLDAGQEALLEMPEMNVGAHDAIAQVIGFVDGSIMPDSPPQTPERRESYRSCLSSRRMSLDADFKIGGDKRACRDVQADRPARCRRYSVGPCDVPPEQFSGPVTTQFPGPSMQAFREISNVPPRYGLLPRTSSGAPGTTKAHPQPPEPFHDSPRETASSIDLYADIPASCSVSAMSCSVASAAGLCGHPQRTPFDTQKPFSHTSGPAAVGAYERYPSVIESRSHVTGHSGLATSGFGAVSCTASGGSGLCRQLSVRQSCGTSISGVTCGTCGGSGSQRRCSGWAGRQNDGMVLVWLGRAVIAGGVALMLLQGRLPVRQRKTNKGVRLRLGPVLKPHAADYSDMEEIILYPPEVLSRQMGNP